MLPTVPATPRHDHDLGAALLLFLLVLLPGLLVPWVGTWALGLSGLLLLVALGTRATAGGRDLGATLASGTALLGGLVAVASAVNGLAALGSVTPHDSRLGFWWLALGLAILATASGLLARSHRVAGSALMLLAGLSGTVAMGLFSINTYYWAAVPVWLLAAVLALAGSPRPRRSRREPGWRRSHETR